MIAHERDTFGHLAGVADWEGQLTELVMGGVIGSHLRVCDDTLPRRFGKAAWELVVRVVT